MKGITVKLILIVGILMTTCLSGCGYSIKYDLTPTKAERAKGTLPYNVAILSLNDSRPNFERLLDARKAKGDKDVGDYTYDQNFGQAVAWKCTEMLTQHLKYARAFKRISLVKALSRTLDQKLLDSLATNGVGLVLTGDLENFYGYYDGESLVLPTVLALGLAIPVGIATVKEEPTSYGVPDMKTDPVAISLAAAAGLYGGIYVESTSKRRIQWRTRLSIKLISTADGSTVWEGSADMAQDHQDSMPGLNTTTRKQQVAVASLRDAVNKLIVDLSMSDFAARSFQIEQASR